MTILTAINTATLSESQANSLQSTDQRTTTTAMTNTADFFQDNTLTGNDTAEAFFPPTTTGELWIHWRGEDTNYTVSLEHASDDVRFWVESTSIFSVYYNNNGSRWNQITGLSLGGINDFDLKISGTEGTLYKNGVQIGYANNLLPSGFSDTTGFKSIGIKNANPTDVGEVIVADSDTRGMRLVTLDAESDGTLNDFSGSATDISGGAMDASLASSASGPGAETYQYQDVPTAAKALGLVPEAVIVGTVASATSSSTAPFLANIVNDSGSPKECAAPVGLGLDSHATPITTVMHASPLTGQAWTVAELDAMEFGTQALESNFEITVGMSASNEYGMATTVVFGSTTKAMTGETINRFFSKSGSPLEFNVSFSSGSNGLISTGETKLSISVLVNGNGHVFEVEYDGSTRYEGVVTSELRSDFVAAENNTVKAIIRPIS